MQQDLQALQDKINITCISTSDIFLQLKQAHYNIRQIRQDVAQIRTNHLLQRSSAMDIENNETAKNTIININKIEQTMKMWKIIQFTTSKKTANSIQTIEIPTYPSISWNDIKGKKNFKFKIIDDPILIEDLIADRNYHHLNQSQDSPLPSNL